MGTIITLALTGGATAIAVALLVWWLVKTVRDSERRASAAEVLMAGMRLDAATRRTDQALAERDRWKDMYEAQRKTFLTFARQHIHAASDDQILALAGGDPGPIGNGLLEPDWDAHAGGADTDVSGPRIVP